LVNGQALPVRASIEQDANLPASCLRALDLTAGLRIALVLHADDPVLLSSSSGAAQAALASIGQWAYKHKVAFHVGPGKSVVLAPSSAHQPVLYQIVVGKGLFRLAVKDSQKWLGLQWPADLNFLPCICKHIAIADSIVALIAGLMQTAGLPFAFGLKLFESKVDGFLRFGRWLLAISAGALEAYETAFARWGKVLLGAPAWRSDAVASLECGFSISGGRRAALDVAVRRARLWLLPPPDLYGALFVSNQQREAGDSWSVRSLRLLQKYGLPDLPELGNPLLPAQLYKQHVRAILMQETLKSWLADCESHTVPLDYLALRTACPLDPAAVLEIRGSWVALSAHRSICRLRAAIPNLGHLNGRRSAATVRRCIYCDKLVRSAYLHVLGECDVSKSDTLDLAWGPLGMRERSMKLLACTPTDPQFTTVCEIMLRIDRRCTEFWSKLH
jgi:hypothetical protein